MNLEVKVTFKTSTKLFDLLTDVNFERLMPENIAKFELSVMMLLFLA
jgi:hypothetical protein